MPGYNTNTSSIKYFVENETDLHIIVPVHDPSSNGDAATADSDPTFVLYQLKTSGPDKLTSGSMSQFGSGDITAQYHKHINLDNQSTWDQKLPLLVSVEATVNSITNASHVVVDRKAEKLS